MTAHGRGEKHNPGVKEKGEVDLGMDYGQRWEGTESGALCYTHGWCGSFRGCRMR